MNRFKYQIFRNKLTAEDECAVDKMVEVYLNELGGEGWHIFELEYEMSPTKDSLSRMDVCIYAVGAKKL